MTKDQEQAFIEAISKLVAKKRESGWRSDAPTWEYDSYAKTAAHDKGESKDSLRMESGWTADANGNAVYAPRMIQIPLTEGERHTAKVESSGDSPELSLPVWKAMVYPS